MDTTTPSPSEKMVRDAKVRGFLVSRNHRVRDALLEGQVPGLHVIPLA
jgi:hypothetical protein